MLGIIRSKNAWTWGACGKHPVGRDYFKVGPDEPFLQAFSDWIKNGYRRLNLDQGANSIFYSWRFWAKGPKKGSLVCGVGRDSSDSIGRPYPFLILGTGPLKGWEAHWDLLPLSLDQTWSQIEYLTTGRFVDFKQMEDEIRSIRPPTPTWGELETQRGRPGELEFFLNGLSQGDRLEMNKSFESLREKAEVFISLNMGGTEDSFDLVSRLHYWMRKRIPGGVPNSIFMGGIPGNTYLTIFMRPLAANDFVRLWSVCGGSNG